MASDNYANLLDKARHSAILTIFGYCKNKPAIMGNAMDKPNDRLNLAYKDLDVFPKEYLSNDYTAHILELDLTHNRIRDLKFLAAFPQLETLILDHNGLTSHMKLPGLPNLTTLWLNHNKISNIGVFINMLQTSCPQLQYLSMMNNPAAPSYFNNSTAIQNKDYRDFVISQLRYLVGLDDTTITADDRHEAERIYKNTPRTYKRISKTKKNKEIAPLIEKYQHLLPDFHQKEKEYLDLLPEIHELDKFHGLDKHKRSNSIF